MKMYILLDENSNYKNDVECHSVEGAKEAFSNEVRAGDQLVVVLEIAKENAVQWVKE